MKSWRVLSSLIKADFLERTRRSSFLVTLCLAIYLGYAVNSGQILIKLDAYRGIYNSAWVGSLMALVITFFLGIAGFYLVKNTIERDEHTAVGQILATTPFSRPQYLLGKWLSNFAVLTTLVAILALAAIFMQMIHREDARLQIWSLIAPFLFIALPMMALVAAFAVFFETVCWLKGGFGNLVYFFLFGLLLFAGVQMTRTPWLDVIGISLVGSSMKAAAKAAFPAYSGSFVLAMISGQPLQTFSWTGLNWSIELIFQRLLWLVVSVGVALAGTPFFNRFDTARRALPRRKQELMTADTSLAPQEEIYSDKNVLKNVERKLLTPLPQDSRFHFNFLRLTWLECLLLVKELKWYWLAGFAVLWIGCAAAPSENLRSLAFMLIVIWPVLIWSKMGAREAHYQTEHLVYPAAYPLARLLFPSWLAGVLVTTAVAGGVLLGRFIFAEPIAVLPWSLAVLFIPTLALTLGIWSRSSKTFEVVYPILWYLGPFNPQNGLAVIDYLGIHDQAPVITSPLLFAGFILLLMVLAFIGRKRRLAR